MGKTVTVPPPKFLSGASANTFGVLAQDLNDGAFSPANLANTKFYSDPTVASSINAGSPSDTDPVSILGDLSPEGNDGTQVVAINQPIWNTTHVTYATNDTINLDSAQVDMATATEGTFAFWYRPVNAIPPGNERLIAFGDVSGPQIIQAFSATVSGKLTINVFDGAVQWQLETDVNPFTNNVWTHIIIEKTTTSCILYIDNVAVAQTFTISLDKTIWFNDFPLIDNGRLGCRNFNAGGDTLFMNADIQQIYISDDVKSATERGNIFNHNQPS